MINLEEEKSRLLKLTEETMERTIKDGLTTNNLDVVYKLAKIKHMEKEDESMNYGNYGGRRAGYDSYGREAYGEYGNYGARGRDMRYRGYEHLDRMYDDYGRYEEGRQRYGANEDTKRSLQYMLKSMEDFARMLKEEAQSQEEIEMIRQTAQRIAQM